MSLCPFCKKSAPSHGPCPSCGRRAEEHPSLLGREGSTLGGGWDDEELATPDLALSNEGGGIGSHGAGGQAAYSGGGVSFGGDDDPFAEELPKGGIELDLIEPHPSTSGLRAVASPEPAVPARPASSPNVAPPPPPSDRALQAASPANPGSSPAIPPDELVAAPPAPAPPQPPSPAALIARFPAPPAKVWETPGYAMRVLWRQFELRQDLESLRKKRSPDVRLYEEALKTHDPKTFAVGLAITCAGVVVASFLFFLPVILRFLRAPD
jgi:hypothetical protein